MKTLVQECVDNMPLVEWQIIFLNVLVILDIQEILLSHVLVSQHVSFYQLDYSYFKGVNSHKYL